MGWSGLSRRCWMWERTLRRGRRVATACGKVARVFDSKTGKLLGGTLAGHTDDVTAVAFSSDGKRVVTGSADKTAKVWELKE